MKFEHEALIAESTRRAVLSRVQGVNPPGMIIDRLFSSLLPVERLPHYIYSVECDVPETKKAEILNRFVRTEPLQAAPFILRGQRLYCFQNLRDHPGPFADIASGQTVEREDALGWWEDDDKMRWYVTLLNRTLNKITGWRKLRLDGEHQRYYFESDQIGTSKSVAYTPMNNPRSQLMVVWQPMTKKTGLPKNFWYHRAVALNFVRVDYNAWCLAVRPEMRVTRDGVISLESKKVGGKVTKKKSKMWNLDVLEELNFWRSFFFGAESRMVVPFGGSNAMVISANFLNQKVQWPGVPAERAKAFKNAENEEQLFEQLALDQITGEDLEDTSLAGETVEEEIDDGEWNGTKTTA